MRITTNKDLGLLAREQRRRLGLGQAQIAKRVGVSRQWIVAFEQGKEGASMGLVLRALRELGLQLDLRVEGSTTGNALPQGIDIDDVIEKARGRRS